jgi:hypothetical protein
MKSVKTLCEIKAPVEEVWKILSQIKQWPRWTDVFSDISVKPEIGGEMHFRILLEGRKRPMKFKATISQWEVNQAIAWKGGVKGIITGEHYLHLKKIDETHTHVIHGEDFGGILPVLFLRNGLNRRIENTYKKFNTQLKAAVKNAHT